MNDMTNNQVATTPDPESNFKVRFAVTRALGPQATIASPEPGMACKGSAILVNDEYLVQQVGPNQAIAHRREDLGDLPLDDEDVKRPYKLQGSPLVVRYGDDGRGAVEIDFEALRVNSERMDRVESDYQRAFAPLQASSPNPGRQGKSDRLQAFMGDARLRIEAATGGRGSGDANSPPGATRDL